VGVALALVFGVGAAPALAQNLVYDFDPDAQWFKDHKIDINKHIQRGGQLGSSVNCGTVCSELYLEEHRPIPGQPSSEKMWASLNKARKATRVIRMGLRFTVVGLGLYAIEEGLMHFLGGDDDGGSGDGGPDTCQRIVNGNVESFSCLKWKIANQQMAKVVAGETIWTHTGMLQDGATTAEATITAPADGVVLRFSLCREPPDGNGPCIGNRQALQDDVSGYPGQESVTFVGGKWTTLSKTYGQSRWMKAAFMDEATFYGEGQDGPAPGAADIAAPVSPYPTDGEINDSLEDFLDSPDGNDLARWYCQQLSPAPLADCKGNEDPWTAEPIRVKVPAPLPDEHYVTYIERLQDLGLVGVAVPLTVDTAVLTRASFAVIRTQPQVGERAQVGTEVLVVHNPDLGPEFPAADPADPSTPVPPDGGAVPWEPPTIREVDLSPLNLPVGCNTFPFGVFCWIGDGLTAWNSGASCPAFTIPFSSALVIDLCTFEPAMEVVRPILVLLAAFSLVYMFAAAAMGFGAATNDD
jgi:hypothetical protein